MSPQVYREVVTQGKRRGESDAFLIEDLVNKGIFEVRNVKKKILLRELQIIPFLHLADIETLALAKELKGIAVIDERLGREIADIEEIENRGTIFILFRLLKAGLLDKKELRDKLDDMIEKGWRCSTELYAVILKELERI